MITVAVDKVLQNREPTQEQKRYLETIKKFDKLVKQGVAEKRKNQLILEEANIKYNINGN